LIDSRSPALVFALVALTTVLSSATPGVAFDFKDVEERARSLAQKPFKEPAKIPDWLLEMSYDGWRNIRFRPEKAWWRSRGLPFEVQFFHPGLFYDRAVKMNEVDAEGAKPIPFEPSMFDYGTNDFASKVPQDLGFAGFRLHYPIKRPEYKDEVIVFLGATYFRALGREQAFGGSARAVAINTALPSGEEFPFYKEFWLVRPTRKATEMTIYALADSPSLTGAFRFTVDPGAETLVGVDARLFRRDAVAKIGIAPLTSMFFHGENTKRWFDDFRPEVHDSDGVLIALPNGEWVWRPIDNPERLNVNSFSAANPKGFGLIQRDRDFDHYQDLETRAELRPSMWVAPRGEWGAGRVEVVEIPTGADYNDNIVTYWVPELAPNNTGPLAFSYVVHWYGGDVTRPPDGRAVATRRESGSKEGFERFIVDFDGRRLAQLEEDTVLRALVTIASGEESGRIVEQIVVKNPVTDGWRLVFQVEPASGDPVELRAYLDLGGEALTETWTYTLLP
jgi:glucans biosynthesis protein